MARRPRIFGPGLLYHVITRGNHRQATFLRDADYRVYLDRLARYRDRWRVTLHAYCLMPNHVHLLAQTDDSPLAKFMQGLQQSYTLYFNRAHDKVGHLFQGRYKAIVCDTDTYLAELVRYIHLNPVRAGLVPAPEDYPYSGHQAYLAGARSDLLDPALVLGLLGGPGPYRHFVLSGLGDGHQEDYYRVLDQQLLGPPGFVDRVRVARMKVAAVGGEQPATREGLGIVLDRLGRGVGFDPGRLRGPDRRWPVCRARVLVAYVLVRRLGYSVQKVATALGRDPATLSSLIGRLPARIESDPEARDTLARLCNTV